jgi:hypothetical protein
MSMDESSHLQVTIPKPRVLGEAAYTGLQALVEFEGWKCELIVKLAARERPQCKAECWANLIGSNSFYGANTRYTVSPIESTLW